MKTKNSSSEKNKKILKIREEKEENRNYYQPL